MGLGEVQRSPLAATRQGANAYARYQEKTYERNQVTTIRRIRNRHLNSSWIQTSRAGEKSPAEERGF